jgi:hypothetical protein
MNLLSRIEKIEHEIQIQKVDHELQNVKKQLKLKGFDPDSILNNKEWARLLTDEEFNLYKLELENLIGTNRISEIKKMNAEERAARKEYLYKVLSPIPELGKRLSDLSILKRKLNFLNKCRPMSGIQDKLGA